MHMYPCPHGGRSTKICTRGDIRDIITHVKFDVDHFRGFCSRFPFTRPVTLSLQCHHYRATVIIHFHGAMENLTLCTLYPLSWLLLNFIWLITSGSATHTPSFVKNRPQHALLQWGISSPNRWNRLHRMHQMQTIVTDDHGVSPSVCQFVSHAAQLGFTVQEWLKGSWLSLGWTFWWPKEHCVRRGPILHKEVEGGLRVARDSKFCTHIDAAFAKLLLWLLVKCYFLHL